MTHVTRSEKSWILYDVANSAFGLVVVTAVLPIFFKEVAGRGLPPEVSTAWWGYANSLSSLLLVILAPTMGVLADYRGWKKRLFALFLSLGLLATIGLCFSGPGTWLFCLVMFVIARTGWAGANIFYDAFLTDVALPADMHRVSTAGFAWGYIGSVLPFLAVIALIWGCGHPPNRPPSRLRLPGSVSSSWPCGGCCSRCPCCATSSRSTSAHPPPSIP